MKRKFDFRRFASQILRLPMAGPVFKLYAPRRRWTSSSTKPRGPRVLIANLMPSLGDTICYMVVADVLREAIPDAEITWLADSAVAGLLSKSRSVTRVLSISTPNSVWKRLPVIKMYHRLFTLMRRIITADTSDLFDLAIVPRGGVDPAFSAHAVWMLSVPYSTAYSHLAEPEDTEHSFGDSLVTDLQTEIFTLHEASRALYLLERSGLVPDALLRWNVDMPIRSVRDISDSVDQNELERKTGVPLSKRFIAISAIAGMPRKTWPAEKFRSLITRILDGTDCLVVLTGTRAEAGAIAAIRDGFGDRVFNIAGKMSLVELAGLLKFASGFVGNDSGTGHVAGALGIPVVSLHVQPRNSDPYHIHSAQHYRPAGPRVRIVQPEDFLAPCQGRCDRAAVHCLDQITVDQVWNALMLALTESCQKPFNAESTACVFLQHNCGKQGRQAD